MKNIKIRYSIMMLILLGSVSITFSQTLDTLKILRLSDSIMTVNTSATLLSYLTRSYVPAAVYTRIPANTNLDNRKLNDRGYTKKFEINTYMTGYEIRLKNGNEFLLKTDTRTDIISWGMPSINFEFDTNYNIIKQPNYDLLNKVYSRIIAAKIISQDSAIRFSQPFFSIKKKRISNSIVEYDVTSDLLYWRISKTKGNYKVLEEQILINAETGDYIKREDKHYVVVIAY
jgi:hypothetical protein